ncbi:MAG: hypothetical protein U0637_10865 [Phycisphaerales bacterium]
MGRTRPAHHGVRRRPARGRSLRSLLAGWMTVFFTCWFAWLVGVLGWGGWTDPRRSE